MFSYLKFEIVTLALSFLLHPDKAGGNKFAKDFEDGSLKLQEFVSFLEKELKTGPPLLEALGNADIFYEMQYKEVKIVANVSFSSNDIIAFPWRILEINMFGLILYEVKMHCLTIHTAA